MASSESNTFEESASITITTNMPTENTATQINNEMELEMETEKDTSIAPAPALQRSAAYRGPRLSETETNDGLQGEEELDPWWSEVENNDLLLDQVPNVTSVFTPTPEAILEKGISLAESESVLKEENFDRLHRIADKIKMTLSEHAKNKEIEEKAERERTLSETSDKENKSADSDSEGNSRTDSANDAVPVQQSLEEFKDELRTKRLQRQNAVQDLRDEIATLRRQLALERALNNRLRRGEHVAESSLTSTSISSESGDSSQTVGSLDAPDDDGETLSRRRHASIELANAQLALQMANSENITLRDELAVVQKQVVTLKEVIACCKQMLAVKEEQCNEIFR